ncbi:MAG: hypothetical protein ACK6EB_38320, partial [Planctomyces sp.]
AYDSQAYDSQAHDSRAYDSQAYDSQAHDSRANHIQAGPFATCFLTVVMQVRCALPSVLTKPVR